MRVLFVSSGNSKNGISPIVDNQKQSLIKKGIDIDTFVINGGGIKGYLKSIFKLRRFIRNNKYDIIHAHYSLSGIVTALSGHKNVIVSLMGSDVKENKKNSLMKLFSKHFWKGTIVKSERMKLHLGVSKVHIIPNGVDFSRFSDKNHTESLNKLGWDKSKKHILFPADPKRPEKDFNLAEKVFKNLEYNNCELHTIVNIPNQDMPYYYTAADLVLFTSKREGSPNVIKEAMACSCPIITTDVGDVRDTIKNTNYCYICSRNHYEIRSKVDYIISQKRVRTNGNDNIKHLNETVIADKIITIYNSLLQE